MRKELLFERNICEGERAGKMELEFAVWEQLYHDVIL
jgi:hypothetical protein